MIPPAGEIQYCRKEIEAREEICIGGDRCGTGMNLSLQQHLEQTGVGKGNVLGACKDTVLNGGAKIPLIGCIVQLYLFGVTEVLQSFLLTVMSYDRYLAICNPLRYSSLMSHRVCVKLIAISWLLALSVTPVLVISAATQEFCNQNTINHFFCDYFPLLELSCSDTSLVRILAIALTVPVVLSPFMLIIGSYICIAHEILKIVSSIGRQKAFSTCSSHLAVVSIFYGTLIGIYVVPTRNQSQTISKLLSLLYTVVTPCINPMIYSLKSADMKNALKIIMK
ncbi:olfactory receptor 1468-like [Xenopus tropicalis]|uniref:Olfactory receptor 1468-like n=1 Tax=Xenopus tropicalis TaxID=8364 RepID=A0A8J1JB47_XENTR|nr:olfactory receptor 1468-like [Xenopus tropicalis]